MAASRGEVTWLDVSRKHGMLLQDEMLLCQPPGERLAPPASFHAMSLVIAV